MNIAMLLQMAADGFGDRAAIGPRGSSTSYASLFARAKRAASWITDQDRARVVAIDVNSNAMPVLLFGAAIAGVPFVPINYRLADDRLRGVVRRTAPSVAVVDAPAVPRVAGIEQVMVVSRPEFLEQLANRAAMAELDVVDGDIAILLFTSGTTGEPKAAVLRHQNLFSYIIGTVGFAAADEAECALVSVPGYHVAGISAVLSSIYSGRRLVYLEQFDPEGWVRTVRDESVTHAMVVPTMLVRILDVLERAGTTLPGLRHLSYGGGRMPLPVIERAMALLPDVDFVNAYGLTETSSTIAVLGPDDHRSAAASTDPAVRLRLGSVGRPLPGIELQVRGADGLAVGAGQSGEVWVRGEQVSGEYLGAAPGLRDGWFATRDGGHLDDGGYLFIDGRMDDVIVRGGENMSPGEIEEVLLRHPDVADVAVIGVPDVEWGESVAALVVRETGSTVQADELRDWVRSRLRSSRVPQLVEFRADLPYTETGKLLRRALRRDVTPDPPATGTQDRRPL
ncbi:fatty acid--CoA ligase family protein [Pseudonocardia aurantiaca]|uniref:Class I adenylate-forming enzyme family protein n=1 Tax=Pseudonocardia aurantiaca TaxID=75290 RepID=A0ABW4FT17_9PSEU